jgi:hypothetical protein
MYRVYTALFTSQIKAFCQRVTQALHFLRNTNFAFAFNLEAKKKRSTEQYYNKNV